jgi:hypothetical protein
MSESYLSFVEWQGGADMNGNDSQASESGVLQ